MTVKELSREQLKQLKQFFLSESYDNKGKQLSWEELSRVDEIISDEIIFNEYADTLFTDDDFFS